MCLTIGEREAGAACRPEIMSEEGRVGRMKDAEEVDVSQEEVGIRVQALDEVVSVNSFFTGAVFIGLAQSNDRNLVAKGPGDPCFAPMHLVRQLVLLEVLAFSCFLMSSLVAQGLKLHLILCRLCTERRSAAEVSRIAQTLACTHRPEEICGCTQQQTLAYVHKPVAGGRHSHKACVRFLRFGILATSVGSLCGTAFLILSIIIIIQLRLGLLSCESAWAKLAAIPLVLLVFFGVLVFASSIFVAFRA